MDDVYVDNVQGKVLQYSNDFSSNEKTKYKFHLLTNKQTFFAAYV